MRSTRFKDAFMEAQKRLTFEGSIATSVGGCIGSSTRSEIEAIDILYGCVSKSLPHSCISEQGGQKQMRSIKMNCYWGKIWGNFFGACKFIPPKIIKAAVF